MEFWGWLDLRSKRKDTTALYKPDVYFQKNKIDMNRQSDLMAAFEENII